MGQTIPTFDSLLVVAQASVDGAEKRSYSLPFNESFIELLQSNEERLFHLHPRQLWGDGAEAYEATLAKGATTSLRARGNVIIDTISARRIDDLNEFLYSPMVTSLRAGPGFGEPDSFVTWQARQLPNYESYCFNEGGLKAHTLRGTLGVSNSTLEKAPFTVKYFDQTQAGADSRPLHGLKPERTHTARSDVYLVSWGAATEQQIQYSMLAGASKDDAENLRRAAMVVEYKLLDNETMDIVRDKLRGIGHSIEEEDEAARRRRAVADTVVHQVSYQMRASNAPMAIIYNGRDAVVIERDFDFDVKELKRIAKQNDEIDLAQFGISTADAPEEQEEQPPSQSTQGDSQEPAANADETFPSPPRKKMRGNNVASGGEAGPSAVHAPLRRSTRNRRATKGKSSTTVREKPASAVAGQTEPSTNILRPLEVKLRLKVWSWSFGHPGDAARSQCDRTSPALAFAAIARVAAGKLSERPAMLDDDIIDYVRRFFFLRGGKCSCMMVGGAQADHLPAQQHNCFGSVQYGSCSSYCASDEADEDDGGHEPDVLGLRRRYFLEAMTTRLQQAHQDHEASQFRAQTKRSAANSPGLAGCQLDVLSMLQHERQCRPPSTPDGGIESAFEVPRRHPRYDLRPLQAREEQRSRMRQRGDTLKRKHSQRKSGLHCGLPPSLHGHECSQERLPSHQPHENPPKSEQAECAQKQVRAENEHLVALGARYTGPIPSAGVGRSAEHWVLICSQPRPETGLEASDGCSGGATLISGKLWTLRVDQACDDQFVLTSDAHLGYGMTSGRLFRTTLARPYTADEDIEKSLALTAAYYLGRILRSHHPASGSPPAFADRATSLASPPNENFDQDLAQKFQCAEVVLRLPKSSVEGHVCEPIRDHVDPEIEWVQEDPYAMLLPEEMLDYERDVVLEDDISDTGSFPPSSSDPGAYRRWATRKRKSEESRQRKAEHDSWRLLGCPQGLCDILRAPRPKHARQPGTASSTLDIFERQEAARRALHLMMTQTVPLRSKAEHQQSANATGALVNLQLQVQHLSDADESRRQLLQRLAEVVVPVLPYPGISIAELAAESRSSCPGGLTCQVRTKKEHAAILDLLRADHRASDTVKVQVAGWRERVRSDERAKDELIERWVEEVGGGGGGAVEAALESLREEASRSLKALHDLGFALGGVQAANVAVRVQAQEERFSDPTPTKRGFSGTRARSQSASQATDVKAAERIAQETHPVKSLDRSLAPMPALGTLQTSREKARFETSFDIGVSGLSAAEGSRNLAEPADGSALRSASPPDLTFSPSSSLSSSASSDSSSRPDTWSDSCSCGDAEPALEPKPRQQPAQKLLPTLTTPGASYIRREDAPTGIDVDVDLWWASQRLADTQGLQLAFAELEEALRWSDLAASGDIALEDQGAGGVSMQRTK